MLNEPVIQTSKDGRRMVSVLNPPMRSTGPRQYQPWRFTDLQPGRWRVYATWLPDPAYATNAPFAIIDGRERLGVVRVNQRLAPSDLVATAADAAPWALLGAFDILSGTLQVILTTSEADGVVNGEAVMIAYDGPILTASRPLLAASPLDSPGTIAGEWQKLPPPCELRNLDVSWHIVRDPYDPLQDLDITIRCATCGEDCGPSDNAECQCDDGITQRRLPKNLTLTLTNKLFCSRLDGSYPMTYHTDPEPPTPGSSFFEFWDSPIFQCHFNTGFFLRLFCAEAGVQSFILQAIVAPGATLHTMYFANECNGAFTQDQTSDSAWACAASTCDPLRIVFPDLLEEGVSGGFANNCCQEDHEGDDREPRLAVEITE